MDLGQKILELRKEKNINREQLAKLIGTSGAIIGRYERNDASPSVEVARKMAEALEVSLDYLVGVTDLKLDTHIIKKIQDIQQMPAKDREHLLYLLDAVLQNVKTKQAFS